MSGPWSGPIPAFEPPAEFWADTQFWAPEVVNYAGDWYLVGTFSSSRKSFTGRSIQILKSTTKSPRGPYATIAKPVTPKGWYCLDGHLFFGATKPYMVFCREWLEVGDGEMYYVELSERLNKPMSEPVKLFSASDAPWTRSLDEDGLKTKFVTDGPFLFNCRITGELIMLWSSLGGPRNGYCVGISRSASGSLFGPWKHDVEPLFDRDGGHAMMFRLNKPEIGIWNGRGIRPLVLALHSPNKDPFQSTVRFYRLNEFVVDGKLALSVVFEEEVE